MHTTVAEQQETVQRTNEIKCLANESVLAFSSPPYGSVTLRTVHSLHLFDVIFPGFHTTSELVGKYFPCRGAFFSFLKLSHNLPPSPPLYKNVETNQQEAPSCTYITLTSLPLALPPPSLPVPRPHASVSCRSPAGAENNPIAEVFVWDTGPLAVFTPGVPLATRSSPADRRASRRSRGRFTGRRCRRSRKGRKMGNSRTRQKTRLFAARAR